MEQSKLNCDRFLFLREPLSLSQFLFVNKAGFQSRISLLEELTPHRPNMMSFEG
jgi:hypothetical protein